MHTRGHARNPRAQAAMPGPLGARDPCSPSTRALGGPGMAACARGCLARLRACVGALCWPAARPDPPSTSHHRPFFLKTTMFCKMRFSAHFFEFFFYSEQLFGWNKMEFRTSKQYVTHTNISRWPHMPYSHHCTSKVLTYMVFAAEHMCRSLGAPN